MMEVISPAVLIINLCVAIFLNSIGIYFLRKVKNRRTYQNIILINMSSAQILMSLMTIPHWALTMNGIQEQIVKIQQQIVDVSYQKLLSLTWTCLYITTDLSHYITNGFAN